MSTRDWRRNASTVAISVIIFLSTILLGLYVWSQYELGRKTYQEYQEHAHNERERAAKQIAEECSVALAPAHAVGECLAEGIASYQGQDAAEQDLQAQQDMAFWAFWMFIASSAAVVVSLFGVVLLVASLRQTRQAIGDAREIGVAEHRPYVNFAMTDARSYWILSDKKLIFWKTRIILSNKGTTPTKGLKIRSCWRLVDSSEVLLDMPEGIEQIKAFARGGDKFYPLTIEVFGSDLKLIQDKKKRLYVFAEAIYGSSISRDEKYVSRVAFCAGAVTGDPTVYWDDANPVVIEWQHVPSYYCFDEECEP